MSDRVTESAPALELAKWIAILAMVVDHAGYLLFDNLTLLRCIGRISFPLFCWVIAVRLAEDPGRAGRYLPRLALWAVLSQLPFWLAFHASSGNPLVSLNIMATLGLGVLIVRWMEQSARLTTPLNQALCWLGIMGALMLGGICDYGTLGVAAIPILTIIAQVSRDQSTRALSVVAFVTNFVIVLPYLSQGGSFLIVACSALLAGPVAALCLRGGAAFSPPRLPGWFFYAFYPVHLALMLIWVFSQLPPLPDVPPAGLPT